MTVQEKLLDPQYCDQELDDHFLLCFASIVDTHWPSLASALSFTMRDTNEIKSEFNRSCPADQAFHMLRKWTLKEVATYGHLYNKLKTISFTV